VKFLGELSSTFEVNSGLRQGNALSLTLLNLGLEKVIRELSHSHQVEVVNKEIILSYADDIADEIPIKMSSRRYLIFWQPAKEWDFVLTKKKQNLWYFLGEERISLIYK
jgi:hypothetical protein